MIKNLRYLIITAILYLTLAINAQDWTVWLYHAEDGLLLHLDADGAVLATRTAPIDAGYMMPHQVVFSHNQQLMATLTHAENAFRQRLTLYQVDDETVIFTFDLPDLDDMPLNADDNLVLSQDAFSQNDEQFAFVSFIAGVGWTIHIVDTATGDMTTTLPYDDPQVIQQPYLKSSDIPKTTHPFLRR